ncbi:MAG: branched-chain amino acid ABC transporter permease, partial [Sneathiella sp.]|nr:branched-chain amino acid ABC transporter permease [Sneathiella sp.]
VPDFLPLSMDQWWYLITFSILLLLFWAAWNLINSRSGRAMMAIRDNPIAARSMGVNNSMYKSLTFGVSAFYTGIAGALSAIVIEFVAPDSFTFQLSILLFIGLVVGGTGSIWGAVFGGLFILMVPNVAEEISTGLSYAVFGVILILVIYVMPSGLAGLINILRVRFKNWL